MALIDLKAKEASVLEQVCKKAGDSRHQQRAQALLWLSEGDGVEEVAERLRISRQTVYNWVAHFTTQAELSVIERLSDAARSGRPPTAREIIDPLIELVIDLDPRDLEYNSTVWTASLLRQFLAEQHETTVSTKSIQRAIARLGLVWKRPRHTLARRDFYWRQAKGASNVASGRIRAPSS
jgi:transposase